MKKNKITHTHKWLQPVVLLTGILVFFLLFFADKTQLENPTVADIASGEMPSGTQNSEQKLPPLAPDEKLDSWVNALDAANKEEKLRLLDSIIVSLQARKRFDYAAKYAKELVELDSSLQNKLLIGELSYEASRLEFVQADSNLFRLYSDQSISYLGDVVTRAPNDDDALLKLGLAYVESGLPQNSMLGIQSLRKVLEINSENADASYHLGVFSIQTGQFDKAKTRFEQVLKLRPDDYQAKYQLAYSLAQLGELAEATSTLQEVIEKAKDANIKRLAQSLLNSLSSS